ncbi:MAG: hypothetical protein EOO73_19175 [Myxococcales bacterium]|nr:MAG: hypothetical protein EOO73_19175 [Myxococcales bacterium]
MVTPLVMRFGFVASGYLALLAVLSCSGSERVFSSAPGEGGAAGQSQDAAGGDDDAEGEGVAGEANGESGHAAGGTGSKLPPQLRCTEEQLLQVGPELFAGSTRGAGDDFQASCFSGEGDDLAIEWLAPKSDYFRFTTAGSSYDTALALFDDECDGAELACNAEASVPQVDVVRFVEKGQRVVVVVDGKAGASGDVVLGVQAVTCPSLDLTDKVLPIELSTQNQGDNSAACGGATKSDRALRFTPPANGLYRFSAQSETFGAIVSVEEGPSCGGAVLGCGYSREGDPGQVVRRLKKGEPVTVFVDGGSGTFELDIEDVSATATCPSESTRILLGGFIDPIPGSFAGAKHLLSASCASTAGFTPVASYRPLVERSYPLSVALTGDGSCQLSVASEQPTVVYLLAGDECAGRELKCGTSTANESHSLAFSSADNGDYVLVVEDLAGYGAAFEIMTSCIL